jgi:hypothetical protein
VYRHEAISVAPLNLEMQRRWLTGALSSVSHSLMAFWAAASFSLLAARQSVLFHGEDSLGFN